MLCLPQNLVQAKGSIDEIKDLVQPHKNYATGLLIRPAVALMSLQELRSMSKGASVNVPF